MLSYRGLIRPCTISRFNWADVLAATVPAAGGVKPLWCLSWVTACPCFCRLELAAGLDWVVELPPSIEQSSLVGSDLNCRC